MIAGVVGAMDEGIAIRENERITPEELTKRDQHLWVQNGLQEPHRRRPSLVFLNRGVRRPVVSYEWRPNV